MENLEINLKKGISKTGSSYTLLRVVTKTGYIVTEKFLNHNDLVVLGLDENEITR